MTCLKQLKIPRKANDSKTTSWKSVEWFQEEKLNQFIGDFVSKGPKRCEKGIIFESKEDFCLSYKRLFSIWWTISASQMPNLKFSNNNQIIHTAAIGDGKCPICEKFWSVARRVKERKNFKRSKIPLFFQTNSAMVQTFHYQSSLIEGI